MARRRLEISYLRGWMGAPEVDGSLTNYNIRRTIRFLGEFRPKPSMVERRKHRKYTEKTPTSMKRDWQYCHYQKSCLISQFYLRVGRYDELDPQRI